MSIPPKAYGKKIFDSINAHMKKGMFPSSLEMISPSLDNICVAESIENYYIGHEKKWEYADYDDQIISAYIETTRKYLPENWEDEEKSILSKVANRIDIESPKILDVGCGKGRLLEWVQSEWNHYEYLGIDKDLSRIKQARNIYKKVAAEYVEMDALAIPRIFSVDLVLCSHVLQHASPADFRSILVKLRSLIADYKYVLISVPVVDCYDRDHYFTLSLVNNNLLENELTEHEYISHTEGDNQGLNILPFIRFSLSRIKERISSEGFELEFMEKYHERAFLYEGDRMKQRDVVMLWRKKTSFD